MKRERTEGGKRIARVGKFLKIPRGLKKVDVDKDVLTLARERVSTVFDRFDHVAVSFSGGKDSTVVLNLCLEEAARRGNVPLDVIFFDEEAIVPETIEYINRVRALPSVRLRWLCWPMQQRNACVKHEPFWRMWDPEKSKLWVRQPPSFAEGPIERMPEGFSKKTRLAATDQLLFPDRSVTVGLCMGIRAQESLRRYQSVASRTYDNWISPSQTAKHVMRCKPIYDWKTEDVWTAPREFGWDYNRAYDKMTMAGIPRFNQRVAPAYGDEALAKLWLFPTCWPELWDRIVARVPGVGSAVRYAGTPLYSYGSKAEKPEGMTWEEAIRIEIDKWGPAMSKKLARRLQNEIVKHYKKTRDPIPEMDFHKQTGLSWSFLLTLAIRGDHLGRHPACYNLKSSEMLAEPDNRGSIARR